MKKILTTILFTSLSTFISAQSLNPTYSISTAGSVDIFKGGYTFAYKTSGAPWDGSLISFGGFANQYDTQINTSYYSNNISFRTRNGDNNVWNNWQELISKDSNGNVGLGENAPIDKLSIKAGHTDSTILLHADNGGNPHAYLSLWASEPQVTYHGVGIGSNVRNATNGGITSFQKIDPIKGASFMRLLDTEINFNIINSSGTKSTPFVIRANDSFFHGKLEAKEVKVTLSPTADFVFEESYNLPKLEDVEKHIKEKKHLPEIASAKEMEKEGVNIGEFQIKLLQKIEELTLYTIEQNKQNREQQEQIHTLQLENKDLKSLMKRVEKLEESSKN